MDCGMFLKGLRIFNGRFISGFVGSVMGNALRCRCRDFAKISVPLIGRVFALTVKLALLLVILRHKKWFGGSSCLVQGFLPVVETLGFKNVAEIPLRDKVVNFVAVCDGELVIGAFNLSPIELSGEGGYVGVFSLTPRFVEELLHIELLFVRDDEPRLEVRDHCHDCLVFVGDVVFQEFLNILVVNSSDDGFDVDRIQNGLESVLFPFHIVLLL